MGYNMQHAHTHETTYEAHNSNSFLMASSRGFKLVSEAAGGGVSTTPSAGVLPNHDDDMIK
jgi:hypothetical protein